ncbi:hypothetical protein JMJ77_0011258 [Colletotrichum scovillei]|uniref:Uncharacterized protein n=1 Tax=Colletotrichum scovillei TaxID=1209932 RepID=A0A9P7UGL3_9PEZI|nr:hypothetical protein JMJ77_0011258 [Colletotrichum scovillei]KAG7060236.1 hypothetical protein JMJ78_0015511 [Colletotrichum scovillei]KAG7067687.1 hypothetical protein JMJ76_0009115 [Colletotrichum scovillei]
MWPAKSCPARLDGGALEPIDVMLLKALILAFQREGQQGAAAAASRCNIGVREVAIGWLVVEGRRRELWGENIHERREQLAGDR